MVEGQSNSNFFSRIVDFFRGLGKPRDETVVRRKGQPQVDMVPPVSTQMEADKLTRMSSSKAMSDTGSHAATKDQWQKLKQSAREGESGAGNLEHWNQKSDTILSGTTFDAASTDMSGRRAHKRPTVVTQARITSNRLQALQSRMEKSENEIDKKEEEDDSLPRH